MNSEFLRYAAFFGRPPDFIRLALAGKAPKVCVGRFPPRPVGLLKRVFTPLHDHWIHITWGMSTQALAVPDAELKRCPKFVELIAVSKEVFVGGQNGEDLVSAVLQALASISFENGYFYAPGHTLELPERLCVNSELRAFFFALPDGVEMSRLCSCTPGAQLLVSVMPFPFQKRNTP